VASAALPHDPQENGQEYEQDTDDDPPRLPGSSILLRDVLSAMGTARRILVDGPFAIRTRNGRFVVVFIVPFVFVHGSHHNTFFGLLRLHSLNPFGNVLDDAEGDIPWLKILVGGAFALPFHEQMVQLRV
jgi:hypothetical protein